MGFRDCVLCAGVNTFIENEWKETGRKWEGMCHRISRGDYCKFQLTKVSYRGQILWLWEMRDMYRQQLEAAILQAMSDQYAVYDYCEFVRKRRDEAKTICLYGTGNFYENYVQQMGKYDYVCDSNPEKWGKMYNGKECISPKQLSELDSVVVFVMLGNYKEVIEELRQRHIECYFFGDLHLNIYNEHYPVSWFEKNRQEMLDALDLFEDDLSKEIYVNAICNRIAPQYARKTFHEMEQKGEYFGTGIFDVGEDECYVDVGAYDGDSIRAFLETVKGKFEQIYGFELDLKNYSVMACDPNISGDNRIRLYNMGISCEEKGVGVVSAGYGSHIVESESQSVRLGCLDTILQDKRVTLIKMDIEGAEMDALKGAQKMISMQHPKLAISVYHKLDDMWKIPQYIKELCSDYKLSLRHHTAVAWDTDCYAYVG